MKRKGLYLLGVLGLILALAVGFLGCVPSPSGVASQGERGLQGLQGLQGNTGAQGIQGERGLKGDKGDKGDTGAQGIQGLRGIEGEEGEEGERGEQGLRGLIGATGATGATGAIGLTGAIGATGEKGDKGNAGEAGVPAMFLVLVPKNSADWSIVVDKAVGCLVYEATGPEFAYCFSATGLEVDTDYSLIYYADTENRFVDWGGDNPGAVIATFVADTNGDIATASGSVELNMSLPAPEDANGYHYDYTAEPDGYAHPFGAKIWLVPTDCLTDGNLPVVVWSPNRFLFETDLIYYVDTD